MKLKQLLLVGILAAGLVGAACLSKEEPSAGVRMCDAAAKLVNSLSDEQKSKTLFAFRRQGANQLGFRSAAKSTRSQLRKGLRFEQMTAEQKKTAKVLSAGRHQRVGLPQGDDHHKSGSQSWPSWRKRRRMVRNPGWYFVSVFGTPSKSGKWGWRVEGHHLSLNFVVERGKIVASTPAFFGANPADIKNKTDNGPKRLAHAARVRRTGQATLRLAGSGATEGLPCEPKQFAEIEQGKPVAHPGEPKGIAAAKLNKKQRDLLMKLVQSYAGTHAVGGR